MINYPPQTETPASQIHRIWALEHVTLHACWSLKRLIILDMLWEDHHHVPPVFSVFWKQYFNLMESFKNRQDNSTSEVLEGKSFKLPEVVRVLAFVDMGKQGNKEEGWKGGRRSYMFPQECKQCGSLLYNLTIKPCSGAPFVFCGNLSGNY